MALRANLHPEKFLLTVPDETGLLAWPDIFENDHPVELEIGAGKGTFLLAAAEANRDINYVGIEYANAYAAFAADRLRRHDCINARMVHAEATWWIRCHVPDASLAALHIYFPDPWPKVRHHKRRLIQEAFIPTVQRILKPGGELRLVTDHAGYFAHMVEVLHKQNFLTQTTFDAAPHVRETDAGLLTGTNFERKYIAQQREFHALAYRKPDAA